MLNGFCEKKEKSRCGRDREKRMFLLILILSFAAVLILNVLTPMLSDDYAYAMEVRKADSVLDLLIQEYHQYMTWNGRSIAHFLLRLFLFLPMPVFKIANSLAFTALSLVMTRLASPREKYDCCTLLLIQLGLWLYAVDFAETILWEDGACNYLWGALVILTFLMAEQNALEEGRLRMIRSRKETVRKAVFLFLLGTAAGWCNENTSGGCLLALLVWALICRQKGAHLPRPFLAGVTGNAAGLAILVLSPGARLRASYAADENYSGLLGLLARFQKITLTIREYFGTLLMAALVVMILLWLRRIRKGWLHTAFYCTLFAATAYALVASRQTQPRAFFGAGLFLMIGIAGGIREVMNETQREDILQAAGWSLLGIMLLQFFFTYTDNAANVGRIWRDETNRVAYIKEQAAAGVTELTVPLVHTDFYNDYSAIGKMEMTEDPDYWINVFYEEYYGIESITAIPYDDWNS